MSPFLPTMGEIKTIGIAISPRKEGALPVTTRGMGKVIPASPGHRNGHELVKTTCSHWSKPLPRTVNPNCRLWSV